MKYKIPFSITFENEIEVNAESLESAIDYMKEVLNHNFKRQTNVIQQLQNAYIIQDKTALKSITSVVDEAKALKNFYNHFKFDKYGILVDVDTELPVTINSFEENDLKRIEEIEKAFDAFQSVIDIFNPDKKTISVFKRKN